MSPDKTFILATGTPVATIDSLDVDYQNDHFDIDEEKQLPEDFLASESWQKFIDRVEENARKMLELKESQLKAQALAETLETKRMFVRHVSHEIRTPLSVVFSGLELVESFKDILGSPSTFSMTCSPMRSSTATSLL